MVSESAFSKAELIFLKALHDNHVRFMVIGMSAAILQGVPGTTLDIDLWFESYTEEGVIDACNQAGGTLCWRTTPPLILGVGLEDLDIVLKCHGLRSFSDEYKKAITVDIKTDNNSIPLRVLPLSRVIKSKEASGRAKDLGILPVLKDTLKLLNCKDTK
jgi:hypothetical protein